MPLTKSRSLATTWLSSLLRTPFVKAMAEA